MSGRILPFPGRAGTAAATGKKPEGGYPPAKQSGPHPNPEIYGAEGEIDWEAVYRVYAPKVRMYLRSHVGNAVEEEDLLSDVFLRVMQNKDRFDGSRGSVSTWIYRITQNRVIDHYRTAKSFAEVPEELSDDREIDAGLLTEETLEELAAALSELPERERDIIVLHYYRGELLKDIASRLGMSYGNVKLVHSKALSRLKRKMGRYAG